MDICQKIRNTLCTLKRIRHLVYNNGIIRRMNSLDIRYEVNPIKIISWNIQCLFFYLNPQKIENIIEKLIEFNADIICLQEVFEDHIKKKIIHDVKSIYPYYLLGNTIKKYKVCEDSGLLILSKYDINYIGEKYLKGLVLPDSLCNKSILYFSVGGYYFVTTHLQADNFNISKKQLIDLIDNVPFNKYILIGDLNHFEADRIVNVENNNKTPTNEGMVLDYILPINYGDIKLNTNVLEIELTNISDHLPIQGEISRE